MLEISLCFQIQGRWQEEEEPDIISQLIAPVYQVVCDFQTRLAQMYLFTDAPTYWV